MEGEAISLEQRIDDSKTEKERLLQDIMDTEYIFKSIDFCYPIHLTLS